MRRKDGNLLMAAMLVTFWAISIPSTCQATNWHCHYTNCLYVFVQDAVDARTVVSARVEYGLLKRKERFGSFTNTVPHKRHVVRLPKTAGGFGDYIHFAAEQHRLWVPFDVGVYVKKIVKFKDGARMAMPRKVYYFHEKQNGMVSCGAPDLSDKIPDRQEAAGRMLGDAVERHKARECRTNDVLFVSKWGYAS